MDKWLVAIVFSVPLLVPVGVQNAFAIEPLLKVESGNFDTGLLQATGANPEDIIFDGGDFSVVNCDSVFFTARAEDFELAEDAFLRDVHLVGHEQLNLPSTGLVYQILEDNSGSPGDIITSGTSVNFQKTLLSGNAIFEYWFDLEAEVRLDGDTRYWISFKTPDDGSNLLLCETDFVFGETAHAFIQNVWVDEGRRYNFKLTGQPIDMVGGEFLPIDSTSLLLAGAQSFSWMIPVVLSVIGIGLVLVRRK